MLKPRVTKTLSLDHETVKAVDKIAKVEKRSFTRQVEVMLENALRRQEAAFPEPATTEKEK